MCKNCLFRKSIREDTDRTKTQIREIAECLQHLTQNLEPSKTAVLPSTPAIRDVLVGTTKLSIRDVLLEIPIGTIPEIKDHDGFEEMHDFE